MAAGAGEARPARTVLWRRLDRPAFDLCRLSPVPDGWLLEGRVLTVVEGTPAEVRYLVSCDPGWATRSAQVTLAAGDLQRRVELEGDGRGRWWLLGKRAEALDGPVDVDLAFTPATNTLPIRRLALGPGAAAEVDALWLGFPGFEVERLRQRYMRIDAARYLYESGGGAFRAELEVDDEGVAVRYGGLWERVAASPGGP